MDTSTARFELLKSELSELQQGIRASDQSMFQVKGWAITVGLAAAGISMSMKSAGPAVLGALAAIAFLLIDAHLKTRQRSLITRALELESACSSARQLDALLKGSDAVLVPGIATHLTRGTSYGIRLVDVLQQAIRPSTVVLYAGLFAVLVFTAATQ